MAVDQIEIPCQCGCPRTPDHDDGACRRCGRCQRYVPAPGDDPDIPSTVRPGQRLAEREVSALMDALTAWCLAIHVEAGTDWSRTMASGLYRAALSPTRTIGPLGLPMTTGSTARFAAQAFPEAVLRAADGDVGAAAEILALNLPGYPPQFIAQVSAASQAAGVVALACVGEGWVRYGTPQQLHRDNNGPLSRANTSAKEHPELADGEVRVACAIDVDLRLYQVSMTKGARRPNRTVMTWERYRTSLALVGDDDPTTEPRLPWALDRLVRRMVLGQDVEEITQ